MTTSRRVHFSDEFFDHLEELLPEERGADGTPSVTDFLVFEAPRIRDRLAADALRATMPTSLPDVRVYINTGLLLSGVVVYMRHDEYSVEVFWLSIDVG